MRVPNLPKCRVRVWMSYRTYRSLEYGYGSRTKLTKVSGTGNTRYIYPLYTLVRTLPNTSLHTTYIPIDSRFFVHLWRFRSLYDLEAIPTKSVGQKIVFVERNTVLFD